MSFVIEVANLIQKSTDLTLPVLSEWDHFTSTELEESNRKDNIKLGGVSRPTHADSGDEGDSIEINMENIMARFNSYSQMMSASNRRHMYEDDEEDELMNIESEETGDNEPQAS